MKKINIILAAMVLLAVSCSRKIDFPHETFITFDDVTFSVNENVGTVAIPVSIYNPTGSEVQVVIAGIGGSGDNGAVEEVDYQISYPPMGVLTFSGSEATKNIEIKLIHDKRLTGTKRFDVQIKSATRGINVGGYNVATVKILDAEHPLASLIGEWGGQMEGATGTVYETTFNIEAVEDDNTFTQLRIDSGIDPMFSDVSNAMYQAVAKDGVITLQSEQLNGYESYYLQGIKVAPDGFYLNDTFGFTYKGNEMVLSSNYGVLTGDGGLAEVYLSGSFVKK